MEFALCLKNQNSRPLYSQLVSLITEKINSGEIKKGDRLPPERELARLTGLARGTITHAYEELRKEKIISSRVGSGYYVIDPKQDSSITCKEAVYLVTKMFSRLNMLNLSNSEIFTLITRELIKCIKPAIRIRVALIECNNTGINVLAKDLSHIMNVDYTHILLSKISQGIYSPAFFNDFDFLVTTTSHYKELIEKLPHLSRKIEQVFFSLTQESIAEFATIRPGMRIGVLCINSHTNAVIKRTLDSFHIPYQSCDSCGRAPAEDIRNYILEKDVLIIEPSSRILDETSILRHIDDFIARGGALVRFHRNVERGSVRHIEELISNLIIDRYTAFLTPSIHAVLNTEKLAIHLPNLQAEKARHRF